VKRGKTGLIIGIVVGALVLCCGGGTVVALVTKSDKPSGHERGHRCGAAKHGGAAPVQCGQNPAYGGVGGLDALGRLVMDINSGGVYRRCGAAAPTRIGGGSAGIARDSPIPSASRRMTEALWL
jgi:hypothetical protein